MTLNATASAGHADHVSRRRDEVARRYGVRIRLGTVRVRSARGLPSDGGPDAGDIAVSGGRSSPRGAALAMFKDTIDVTATRSGFF